MGGRGSAGGGLGTLEPKGRRTSLAKFLENQQKRNIEGMLQELQKQKMEVSDAKFTANYNAVKAQFAQIKRGNERVSVRFYNGWEPTQVARPTGPIKTTIEAVTYRNGNVVAFTKLVEKKSTSLKNAAKNYESVLEEWKRITKQKKIRFKQNAKF